MHKHSSHCSRGLTDEERLDHFAPTRPDGGCWPWEGTINRAGYGVTGWRTPDGRYAQERAHRLAYKAWVGPIPEGYVVDHVRARGCRLKSCVNPAHLEAVPSPVNTTLARTIRGDRGQCVHGHDFDIERRVGDKVYRDCLTCRRDRGRRYDATRRRGTIAL